jgi:hypothetical protein
MFPKRREMPCPFACRLVEEANDLASGVLSSRLLVIHDARRRGQDHVSELTGREQLDDPLLQVGKTDVVPRGDDTGLVQAANESVSREWTREEGQSLPAIQLHHDLAGPVVVDLLELSNVT